NSFEVLKLLENSVEVLKILENKLESMKILENKLESMKILENKLVGVVEAPGEPTGRRTRSSFHKKNYIRKCIQEAVKE
nr:hypothetical protein [Tanacetum cinerariifolium]